jgi:hypothetical protein
MKINRLEDFSNRVLTYNRNIILLELKSTEENH